MRTKKSIIEIVSEHGIDLKPIGSLLRGFCPFHDDQGKPNFTVYPETDSWFCFACVLGNSTVLTPQGLKTVSKIKIGDFVLGKNGQFKKVLNISSRISTKQLQFLFKRRNIPLIVTPEHRIFVLRGVQRQAEPKKSDWYNLRKRTFVECFADDVNINDFMGVPYLEFFKRKTWHIEKYFKNHGRKDGYGVKPKRIPKEITLSEDLLWLIGLYIAEGHSSEKTRSLRFTLHKNELSYANRVLNIIKNNFGLSGKIYFKKKSQAIDVIFCNVFLVDVFSKACGIGAKNKHIPYELFLNGDWSILNGLFDGDAYYFKPVKDNFSEGTKFSTISKELAWQVYFLLISHNKSPLMYENKSYVKDKVHHKKSYHLYYRSRVQNRKINGFYTIPIFSKKVINKKSLVYDLTVDGGEFVVDGIRVHNCGEGGDAIQFLAKLEGVSYKTILVRFESANVDLEDLQEKIDGAFVENEPEIYNQQANILISRIAKGYIQKYPDKAEQILEFLQKFDLRLLKPIYFTDFEKIIVETRQSLEKLV